MPLYNGQDIITYKLNCGQRATGSQLTFPAVDFPLPLPVCCSRPGVRGVGLAGAGLPGGPVQPVPPAVLPVGGGAGGCLAVGRVDQRALPLPLPLLQRRHRLQDLRLVAADRR